MKLALSIFLSVTVLTSCAEESDAFIRDKTTNEGSIKNGVYTSKQFGWSIKIHPSWEIITSSSEFDDVRKLGRAMIDDANLDLPQSKEPVKLLFAKKNVSSIVAIAEKIAPNNNVSIEQQAYAQKQVITKMYDTQGFPIMESGIDEGTLGGEKCGVVRFVIGQKPLQLWQLYYVFKRKGHWLSIIATFDNNTDRDEIYEALNGCTFD
jgi:hypothetical protein